MGQANAVMGKSGSYLVDFSSADDMWRKLADTPAAPMPRIKSPPPSFTNIESGVNMGAVARARTKSAGFVVSESPRMTPAKGTRVSSASLSTPDPWSTSERRLWLAAGGLMGLAILVLSLFAVVSVGHHATTAAEPAPLAIATPIQVAPAVSTAPAWRPSLPARIRVAEAKPAVTVGRKHKSHKSQKHGLHAQR